MADWAMGSLATGRVEAWENWNNADQVSMHYKLSCEIRGGAYNTSGPTWSGNIGGGHVGSGNWTYTSNGWRTLREFDVTFNKDANGYINIGVHGYINGANSPYVTSGQASWTHYPTRYGYPPPHAGSFADTITDSSVRLGNEIGGYGKGTSAAMRMYYKPTTAGGYSQTGDQGDVGGYNTWSVTGLTPNTNYHYFGRQWNNNGDTGDGGVSTFKTLPRATPSAVTNKLAVSFQVPVTVSASASGEAAPTTRVQYRKQGSATWLDTATSTSMSPTFSVSGLMPYTTYEYRTASVNSTGTYYGATQTVTTLPAATLIYSDGTKKSGIPRRINADGTATMLNIKRVGPL